MDVEPSKSPVNPVPVAIPRPMQMTAQPAAIPEEDDYDMEGITLNNQINKYIIHVLFVFHLGSFAFELNVQDSLLVIVPFHYQYFLAFSSVSLIITLCKSCACFFGRLSENCRSGSFSGINISSCL